MKVDIFELIDVCCEVYDDPSLKPKTDDSGNVVETYCNIAVQTVCALLGYQKFYHLMANEMVSFMEAHPEEWERIDMDVAQDAANAGRIVIAGLKMDGHGHVAVVRPGLPRHAPKWSCRAPKVMNVGAKNSIGQPLNWVVKDKPQMFALR